MFNNISIPPEAFYYIAMSMAMFFISFAGALCAEQFFVIQGKSKEVKQTNALMYSVVISFLTIGFLDKLINIFGRPALATIVFLLGCSANKFIYKVFDGSLLKFVIKFSKKVKDDAVDSAFETFIDGDKEDTKKNKTTRKRKTDEK